MTRVAETSRDPVCGMDVRVAGSTLFSTHQGLVYHFCSAQCMERFNELPTLYIGGQRVADIRPIEKRRRLRFSDANDAEIENVCQRIGKMMGVFSVVAQKDSLLVEYDLRQASLSQIEAVTAAAGVKIKGGLHGVRRSLWKLTEANELESASHSSTGACCNRPPAKIR